VIRDHIVHARLVSPHGAQPRRMPRTVLAIPRLNPGSVLRGLTAPLGARLPRPGDGWSPSQRSSSWLTRLERLLSLVEIPGSNPNQIRLRVWSALWRFWYLPLCSFRGQAADFITIRPI